MYDIFERFFGSQIRGIFTHSNTEYSLEFLFLYRYLISSVRKRSFIVITSLILGAFMKLETIPETFYDNFTSIFLVNNPGYRQVVDTVSLSTAFPQQMTRSSQQRRRTSESESRPRSLCSRCRLAASRGATSAGNGSKKSRENVVNMPSPESLREGAFTRGTTARLKSAIRIVIIGLKKVLIEGWKEQGNITD